MTSLLERVVSLLSGETKRFDTPGDLAQYIDPRTIQTPALALIDRALVRTVESEDESDKRQIITMPPQEGKSVRVSRFLPLWLLRRNPDLRIAIVSYSDALSRRHGRQIRNDITAHPELGMRLATDNRAANDWALAGFEGGIVTVGIGSGLSGRPVDVLIIDDPIKDQKEADSKTIRQNVWDWWTAVGSARLAPGAIVIVITTRWHEDDLVGRLIEDAPDVWKILNIPARADHDPALGETDPLGREPGEYMISARGRTEIEWRARERAAGSRVWLALYQGRPSAREGNIFRRDWWCYRRGMALRRSDGTMTALVDEVAISVDAAFKDTDGSDFVCIQVWGFRGAHAYLLHQLCDRMEFTATVAALIAVRAAWPQCGAVLIEDKANGPAIISQLREHVPGIIAVTPVESKEARARAVSPFCEAGNVFLNEGEPWVDGFVTQCASFPNAEHDDMVDAMSQMLRYRYIESGFDFMGALLAEMSHEKDDPLTSGSWWTPQA